MSPVRRLSSSPMGSHIMVCRPEAAFICTDIDLDHIRFVVHI